MSIKFPKPQRVRKKNTNTGLSRVRKSVEPISALFPHLITVTAICCGLTSIRFALLGHYAEAITAILIAAILDGMDGKIARMLGTASHFGAELDSFADLINFGVAPCLVMYFYSLNKLGETGWGICLFFCVCIVLRLARFNVMAIDESKQLPWAQKYCVGVPSPAGAILAIGPLIIDKAFQVSSVYFAATTLILVAFMLVSRLPTLSFKKIPIPPGYGLTIILGTVIFLVCLFSAPWYSLSVIVIGYFLSIPIVMLHFQKHELKSTNYIANILKKPN